MKYLLIICSFIFSNALLAQPSTQHLQDLLDLDRFEDYTEQWANTMRGRKKPEMAKAISGLRVVDFRTAGIDPKRFIDAFNYDAIILEILNKKFPAIKATKADVAWDYNFLKRKLNVAYKLDTAAVKLETPSPFNEIQNSSQNVKLVASDAKEVLLDVDSYAAGRTTRAVFWEASQNQRPIDLYVGNAGDFKNDLVQRGGKVIAEVETMARNYNPIYLVQYPGEKDYHYAITQIGGNDRLTHFQMQSSLVRWEQSKGKLAPPPPMNVIGSATQNLLREEATLTQVLKTVPRADHVIIGQKGAFERTFGSMGKIQSVLDLMKIDLAGVTGAITPAQLKQMLRAQEITEDTSEFAMKYASDLDKIYEKLNPLLTKNKLLAPSFTAYSYDRGSYEMSDYILKGEDGKPQRWRVFSNVWGDEVLPIAKSLKTTGYSTISYIGTAGALPGSNLKVGDLVRPKMVKDLKGNVHKINSDIQPEGVKIVDAVTHVASPFEETNEWLAQTRKFAQAVEVETGFLSTVFNGPNDRLNVMLLISDAVGVEGETLAHASSSVRRKAQISAISELIDQANVDHPSAVVEAKSQLAKWMDELVPSRDPVSRLQIIREAEAQGITTKADLAKFLKEEKSFTTARLEKSLESADNRLSKLASVLNEKGIKTQLSVQKSLLDGRFNPAKAPVEVHISITSATQEKDLKAVLAQLKTQDKAFDKSLKITMSKSTTGNTWIKIPGDLGSATPSLSDLYHEGVLKYGGLAMTETRSGGLKFVQVSEPAATGIVSSAVCKVGSSGSCDCVYQALNTLLK